MSRLLSDSELERYQDDGYVIVRGLFDGDEIDLLHRRVRSSGQQVQLSPRLYDVLRVLVENAGKIVTHEELLRSVWGEQCLGRVAYLRIAIKELRRKLEIDPTHPQHIVTETRVGYRLEVHRRIGKAHK